MQTDLVENLEGRLRVTRELAAAPHAGQADALARRRPGLIIMPSEITGKAAPLARRDDYQRRETEFTVALGTHAPDGTLHLAVALDGAGWHPAAWREPDAQPDRLFTGAYWVDRAQRAERGLLDFVTIEDGLDLQSEDRLRRDERTDRVRGRLDAVLIAARAAPKTRGIGFVPTAVTTHTEPFHTSKAIATLDYVSSGRAGPARAALRRGGRLRRGAATALG